LEGVRVVELGVWHAGPGGGAILGQLGAEVIKVESLVGDPERHNGPFGNMNAEVLNDGDWTLIFELSNHNKKSVQIDVSRPEGLRLIQALLREADVFLTNLRTETLERLGLDYKSVREVNDKIIYSGTTGFGPEGPMRNTGGFDTLGQAYSGMLYLLNPEEPTPLSTMVLDQLAAIVTGFAIMTALVHRERTGEGQDVYTSLLGTGIWSMYVNLFTTAALGTEVDTEWKRRRQGVLRSLYKCADGEWIACVHNPEEPYWAKFCAAIGRPDLAEDPSLATRSLRIPHLERVYDAIDAAMLERTSTEWLEIFGALDLFFTPVRRFRDVLVDPQVVANDYVETIDHPALGRVTIPSLPITFGRSKPVPHEGAPRLGADTAATLGPTGCDESTLEELRRSKIIG
jgi:crotonobetainyl-CoA:carnitine CoA-transferase CaiB-like acyl-CoA transferase